MLYSLTTVPSVPIAKIALNFLSLEFYRLRALPACGSLWGGPNKSKRDGLRPKHQHDDLMSGPHEDVEKENTRLRKKVRLLREEREVLKKAAIQ